jgi:GMP synthase (glutamine-hydrolysing)
MGSIQRVFHWHGDTFDLPENAILLASSAATKNQAYLYNRRVLALQFHLEQTVESMNDMIKSWGGELKKGKYVQTPKELLNNQLLDSNKKILFEVLNRLADL